MRRRKHGAALEELRHSMSPGGGPYPMAPPDAFTRPTASMVHDPFFVYTTGQIDSGAISASATGKGSISIQAAENFLCRYITCDFDQTDWTFRVTMGGLSANLFNEDVRGSLIFGQPSGTGVSNWPRGMELTPPMLIPSNTTISFSVTNGPTGALNIFFALIGNRLTT